MPQSTARLESIHEAAERCGVSTRTIRRRIADGQIRAYRLGPRLIRIHATEVDALLRPIPTTPRTPAA